MSTESQLATPHAKQKWIFEASERDGDLGSDASLSGDVTICYLAVVENNLRQLLPPTGRQHLWSDLPGDVLPFLHKLAHYGKYFPLHSDGLMVPLLKCSLAASRGLRAIRELKRRFLKMQINWIELASLC
jgi:hypothetical protein